MSAAIVLPKLVYKASPNVSSRRGTAIDLFVLHETVGSYRSAVSWLSNPVSQASAHFVLNEAGTEVTQLVPLSLKAWTQGNKNPRCVSLELATISAKGYHSLYQLRVAARIAAWVCWKQKLPPFWTKRGAGRGLTYHGDMPDSGSHPYCGPDAAGWKFYCELVADEYERGGFRKTWAKL